MMKCTGSELLLRADAGAKIGTGHVMRCLALAQAWQDLGGRCIFVTAADMPLLGRLREESFDVHRLGAAHFDSADLTETKAVVAAYPGTWVVLDGHHFDQAYQKALRDAGARLLVIDDAGSLPSYHADLILNQNLGAENVEYRAPGSTKLLGTHFALLRREFAAWRTWQRTVPAKARKILVTMGGADPDNVTLKVVRALAWLTDDTWEAVVVIGAANAHLDLLQAVSAECRFPIRIERAVRDMSSLMAWADLAVAAAGSTSWELCFMGLPSFLVELAANQSKLAQALHECGAVINAGWHADIKPADLAQGLAMLADDTDRRNSLARTGRGLVDGRGAQRVVEAFGANGRTLLVRRAGDDDCRIVWEWANDIATLAASFSSSPIPWEQHVAWFREKLSDPECFWYMVTDAHCHAVGTVRYDIQGNDAAVTINIGPTHRGRGLGSAVLRKATVTLFGESNVKKVIALVKPENRASVAIFERAGYTRCDSILLVDGHHAVQLVLKKDE